VKAEKRAKKRRKEERAAKRAEEARLRSLAEQPTSTGPALTGGIASPSTPTGSTGLAKYSPVPTAHLPGNGISVPGLNKPKPVLPTLDHSAIARKKQRLKEDLRKTRADLERARAKVDSGGLDIPSDSLADEPSPPSTALVTPTASMSSIRTDSPNRDRKGKSRSSPGPRSGDGEAVPERWPHLDPEAHNTLAQQLAALIIGARFPRPESSWETAAEDDGIELHTPAEVVETTLDELLEDSDEEVSLPEESGEDLNHPDDDIPLAGGIQTSEDGSRPDEVVDRYRDGTESDTAPGSVTPLPSDAQTEASEVKFGDFNMDEDTALPGSTIGPDPSDLEARLSRIDIPDDTETSSNDSLVKDSVGGESLRDDGDFNDTESSHPVSRHRYRRLRGVSLIR